MRIDASTHSTESPIQQKVTKSYEPNCFHAAFSTPPLNPASYSLVYVRTSSQSSLFISFFNLVMDSPSGLISLRTAVKIFSRVGNGSLACADGGDAIKTKDGPKSMEAAITTLAVAFFADLNAVNVELLLEDEDIASL